MSKTSSVLSTEELACTYAMLVLIDDDVAVTADKISAILKAANVDVEPFWPGLFAKAVEGIDAKQFITTLGSGAGGGASNPVAATTAMPAAAEVKKEEKKVEPESDSDSDMGLGLFD